MHKLLYQLSDQFAGDAAPPKAPAVCVRYYDKNEKGFGLQVHESKRRTWIVASVSAAGKRSVATLGPVYNPKDATSLTEKQARKAAQKEKARAAKGQSQAKLKASERKARIPQATPIPFRELAKRWMTWGTTKADPWAPLTTARQFQRDLDQHILPRFGKLAAASVTPKDVQRCYDDLAAKSVGVARNVIAALRGMFSYGMSRVDGIDLNPASSKRVKIDTLKPRKTKFTPAMLKAIIDELDGQFKDHPGTSFIQVMASTGCRCGECFAIQPDQIEGRWWRLTHEQTKQKSAHSYRLTDRSALIANAVAASPLSKSARYKQTDKLFDMIKSVLAERGIILPKGRYHNFRRSRVTELVKRGIPMAVAGKAVGHRSVATTEAYFSPDELDIANEIDRVDAKEAGQ